MILQQILDNIAAMPSGAVVDDSNRWDFKFVLNAFNAYRANYLRDFYRTNSTLNNKWYQKYYPEYSVDNKGDCYVGFPFPAIVTLDEMSDGLRYFGTRNGHAFTRIKNLGSYSTFSNHRYTNPQKIDETTFLFDASSRMVRVYGNGLIEDTMGDCVFDNPLDALITTFNKNIDEYPVPDDAIPTILQMIYYGQTRIAAVTQPVPAGYPMPQPKPVKQK